jgi:hypothetical protein
MTLQLPKPPAREDLSLILRWMEEMHGILESTFNMGADGIRLKPLYTEPPKPRPGVVVYVAAEVSGSWDPDGSGNGGYFGYHGSAWVKLG